MILSLSFAIIYIITTYYKFITFFHYTTIYMELRVMHDRVSRRIDALHQCLGSKKHMLKYKVKVKGFEQLW